MQHTEKLSIRQQIKHMVPKRMQNTDKLETTIPKIPQAQQERNTNEAEQYQIQHITQHSQRDINISTHMPTTQQHTYKQINNIHTDKSPNTYNAKTS